MLGASDIGTGAGFLLECMAGFVGTRREWRPLDCGLLVVDEASMIDTSLMFAVMKAIPPQTALLLVGDVD